MKVAPSWYHVPPHHSCLLPGFPCTPMRYPSGVPCPFWFVPNLGGLRYASGQLRSSPSFLLRFGGVARHCDSARTVAGDGAAHAHSLRVSPTRLKIAVSPVRFWLSAPAGSYNGTADCLEVCRVCFSPR